MVLHAFNASLLWHFPRSNQLRLETGHYAFLHTGVFDTYAQYILVFHLLLKDVHSFLMCFMCLPQYSQKLVIDIAEQLLPELVSVVD